MFRGVLFDIERMKQKTQEQNPRSAPKPQLSLHGLHLPQLRINIILEQAWMVFQVFLVTLYASFRNLQARWHRAMLLPKKALVGDMWYHVSSDGLQPSSDGLQPSSDGLQPSSDGLDPTSDGLQPCSDGLQPRFVLQRIAECRPCWQDGE